MSRDRDYYCNNKFKFLKIDLEKKSTYNCHAAAPHPIDLDWLQENPGEIFNSEISVLEREQMLRNERNSSCEQNCWFAEDHGGVGPRILEKGYERTHFKIRTNPEIIDLTIGSDCNLKCTYCCKEFSSTWRNDIVQHGPYVDVGDPNRFSINQKDAILMKHSQKEKIQFNYYKVILNELRLIAPGAAFIITGGEPMLHNSLLEIVDQISQAKQIKLFTGLGVDIKRFERMIERLAAIPSLYFCVSIENTGKLYEFNRYGMNWDDADKKIQLLKQSGARVMMHSTLSNLSLFGFADFYDRFSSQHEIEVDLAYTPDFMPIYVMDDQSKENLSKGIETIPIPVKDKLLKTLQIQATSEQRLHLKNFLLQFVTRNVDLSLDIFPSSFVRWIDL